jgi:hypothetical protein
VKHINDPRVPRVAQRLLRLRTAPAVREFVLGDLEEGFVELARTVGARHARRWYWRQTWRCLFSAHGQGAISAHDAPRSRVSVLATSITSILRDIGFALRLMPRAPAVSIAAVLTFALGIGANVAIFSVAWPALVHPYPFRTRIGWFASISSSFSRNGPIATRSRRATSPIWRERRHSPPLRGSAG